MKLSFFSRSLLAGSIVSLLSVSSAWAASDLLTRAEVYKLVNRAQILPNNRPARPARLSDVLVPQDGIQTAARSRAELLFNEGSLARVGSNAIFRFKPGLRGFQLRNGVAVIMNLPTASATRIETLEGQAIAEIPPTIASNVSPPSPDISPDSAEYAAYYKSSTAMIVVADSSANKVEFYNLTSSPIQITDAKGTALFIKAGETVSVLNGTIGQVNVFDLRSLYTTSGLAAGLGNGQEKLLLTEPARVQQSLRGIRVATLQALGLQARLLEGLCTLNGRGGASTLSTNCITTDSDDPLRTYQDRRDVVTPIPERPQEPPQEPPVRPSPEPPPTGNPTNPTGGNGNTNGGEGIPVLIQGENTPNAPR